ncbi:MAG: ComF family protein [Coxiellaceae bacterium]|nr:ComF family protein [Coxiellaceae bacterium]
MLHPWQACLFCQQPGWYRTPICDTCHQLLPWLGVCCPQCANPTSSTGLCGQCIKQPPSFDNTLACFNYQPPISHMITQLKFKQQLCYGQWITQLLIEKIKTNNNLPEAIMAVPLHKKRIKQRGYNQAGIIAQTISNQLQIPCIQYSVIRHKATAAQTDLSAKQRQINLRHAFTINNKIDQKHIALVDDVMTTGSTLNALAALLKQQGVQRVDCYTIARAALHN